MGLLMMILTIGGLGLAFILLIVGVWTKQLWLSKFVVGASAIWLVFYTIAFLGVSLASTEKTFELNETTAFYNFHFDLNMQTTISDGRTAKQIGSETAQGIFYNVEVKISNDTKNSVLGLLNPQFSVIDKQHESFKPIEDSFVFDLPIDVKNPRLDIGESIGIDKVTETVLIGDKDSFLHKRNRFKLDSNQTINE